MIKWKYLFWNLFLIYSLAMLLVFGCGEKRKEVAYKLLSVQDFSHGPIGKFSAKVYISKDISKEDARKIIKDITAQIRKENNADVVWLVVYSTEIPTFDSVSATTQWINSGLKKELRPYVEKSDDSVLLEDSPVYITWKQEQ